MKKTDEGTVTISIERYQALLDTEENLKSVINDGGKNSIWIHDSHSWGARSVQIISNDKVVDKLVTSIEEAHKQHQSDLEAAKETKNSYTELVVKSRDEAKAKIKELEKSLEDQTLRIPKYSPLWDLLNEVISMDVRDYVFSSKKGLVDKEEFSRLQSWAVGVLKGSQQ
jgi:hypothetical protein